MPFRTARFLLALLAWSGCAYLIGPVAAREARAETAPAAPVFRQSTSEPRIVAFGLFGPQRVFASEARGAARALRAWLGARTQPSVQFNTRHGGSATIPTLRATLRSSGATMDPNKDVLVLVLTSHGSPAGLAVVAGRSEGTLTPPMLREMLDASGAKYRIVIISACYSGVFIPVLADPRTLVITAAAADRPSFGCEDRATWTFFGEAFFNIALKRAPSLEAAFATARALVTAREQREGFTPSNPQIAGGSEVLALLATR
jgi:Peptidase C13 family